MSELWREFEIARLELDFFTAVRFILEVLGPVANPTAMICAVIRLFVCKTTLASLLRRAAPALRFNEHLDEEDGPLVFAHACKIGLEGIVSKRKDSPYRSGRSPHWIKSKNPTAPAVKREAEEDWGR